MVVCGEEGKAETISYILSLHYHLHGPMRISTRTSGACLSSRTKTNHWEALQRVQLIVDIPK